ncbi:MAG: glycosyltransferase [Thermodesulfobacteriota bacterium]
MKVLHYCQHVLGMGHLFRSLAIDEALAGEHVLLVTGGAAVPVRLPAHVREIRLPALMMDAAFTGFQAQDAPVEAIWRQRQEALLALCAAEAPDLFLVELYPFGRKAFRRELDPVLAGIRDGRLPACRVVSSLRDVLVEKKDTAGYEERVVSTLNRFFDAVLVHADPAVLSLAETFGSLGAIRPPVRYTGFVAPRPGAGAFGRVRQELGLAAGDILVVASGGGGAVAGPLLRAVAAAWPLLQRPGLLLVLSGPFLPEADLAALQAQAGPGLRVERFSDQFLDLLAAADLSVSMAGYNTTMNILATGVPALVWPFDQNREQRLRAERLGARTGLGILEDEDLEPAPLARRMAQALGRRAAAPPAVDLDGAARTASLLRQLVQEGRLP